MTKTKNKPKVHFYDYPKEGLGYISWDWATCPNPKCRGSNPVEAEVLWQGEGRPPRYCDVCIWTCSHVIIPKRYKCWHCSHIWVEDRTYS